MAAAAAVKPESGVITVPAPNMSAPNPSVGGDGAQSKEETKMISGIYGEDFGIVSRT
jgi:hypothetical protein